MHTSSWKRQRFQIKCCHGCVAPKRYPGCGDHCKEYKEEKAELARQKAAEKAGRPPIITQYDYDQVRSCASRKHK